MTPLHVSASSNDVQVLEMLIEANRGDINLANNDGWTPVHFAGCLNNFDSLNLLLEHGGKMNFQTNGLKAYEEIVRSDNAELLECIFPLIIDDIKGRNVDREGGYGLLHLAATGSPKCLDLLLSRKEMTITEICNSRDRSSALHFAVMSEKPDNVRILLRHGANVN